MEQKAKRLPLAPFGSTQLIMYERFNGFVRMISEDLIQYCEYLTNELYNNDNIYISPTLNAWMFRYYEKNRVSVRDSSQSHIIRSTHALVLRFVQTNEIDAMNCAVVVWSFQQISILPNNIHPILYWNAIIQKVYVLNIIVSSWIRHTTITIILFYFIFLFTIVK